MGRIRTIKPEFPQSESVGKLSREARLCFILLWTLADDSGRARGNSRGLASLLYPFDDDAPNLIEGWLDELSTGGHIVRYQVGESTYLQICKWLEHQKIDKPSKSKFPSFDEGSRILANPRESSTTDQGPRTKDLDQGPGQGPLFVEQARPGVVDNSQEDFIQLKVHEIFEYWKKQHNHPKSMLDEKREKAIRGRLQEGYTVERIKNAVDGIKLSPHHMGQNDRNTVYDDIELICRTGSNVDKLADLLNKKPRMQGQERYENASLSRIAAMKGETK